MFDPIGLHEKVVEVANELLGAFENPIFADFERTYRHSYLTARSRRLLPRCATPLTPSPAIVAISGAMRAAQPNEARRAFAESTVPGHAIPLPPARLRPPDDHVAPALPVRLLARQNGMRGL